LDCIVVGNKNGFYRFGRYGNFIVLYKIKKQKKNSNIYVYLFFKKGSTLVLYIVHLMPKSKKYIYIYISRGMLSLDLRWEGRKLS
jgi:hypothetical protein